MNLEGRIGEFKPLRFVIAMALCLLFGVLIFKRLTFEVDTKKAQDASQKAQLQSLAGDVSELRKQLELEKIKGCAPQSGLCRQLKTSARKGTQK